MRRRSRHRRGRPRIPTGLSVVLGIAFLVIVGWVELRPPAVVGVRLTPGARGAAAAALQSAGFTVVSPSAGGQRVYTIGGPPDRPSRIAFLASRPGQNDRVYAARIHRAGHSALWTIGPARVIAGSTAVDVAALNGFGDSLFYALAMSGQTETLVVRDLMSQATQTYFFNGPVHAVQISPHGHRPVRMAVVQWRDRAGRDHRALLWRSRLGWRSLSVGLSLPLATPDRTSVFVRLVELTRHWLGPLPVALAEDSWFTAVDRVRRVLDGNNHAIARASPTSTGPMVHRPFGPPPAPMPTVARATGTVVTGSTPMPTVRATPMVAHRPGNLVLPVSWLRDPGEGVWLPAGRRVVGRAVMQRTFVLPDPRRSYARVNLVWIDQQRVHVHLVAGTRHPRAASGLRGTGVIPWAARPRLLAAFNGGFKRMRQSYNGFGFRAGGEWFVPPTRGLATLAIDRAHRVILGAWGRQIPPTPAPHALLQNLPLLVDQGQVSSRIDQRPFWGITVSNAVRVWRSGLGQTAAGDLIYAAGPSLTARSLARALIVAGARRGMELDINSYWVTFNFYAPIAPGAYRVRGWKLIPSMTRLATRYLRPDRRDFVYLTAAP